MKKSSKPLPHHLTDFLDWLDIEKGLASKSPEHYARVFKLSYREGYSCATDRENKIVKRQKRARNPFFDTGTIEKAFRFSGYFRGVWFARSRHSGNLLFHRP